MNILLKSLTIVSSLIAGLQAIESDSNKPELPNEMTYAVLTEFVKDNYIKEDFENFIEIVRPLRTVCQTWNAIIDNNFMHKAMALGCEQICPGFLNGKLIYTPQDGGKVIELLISDLWNPLEGTFDLSQCGDTGNYLSISTGYRKGKRPENADKLEIWFAPRFLVENEIDTTAGHLKIIFPSKWPESAQVGMLVTWGGSYKMDEYGYLTTENVDNLSKINLYENWRRAAILYSRDDSWLAEVGSGSLLSSFVYELK